MVRDVGTIIHNNEQSKRINKYMNDVPVNCLPANEPPVCTGNFCRLISHHLAETKITNRLRYFLCNQITDFNALEYEKRD